MLGKRERVYSLGHKDLSGWECFCKDAARDTASRFIEQVRRYKDRDTTAADVSESQFVDKFSAFFLEEVLTMSGCTTSANVGGNSSNYSATKLPHCYKPSRGGGKAWWNIFKWSKFSKGEAGLSSSRKISASSAEGRKVLEGVVNLLDMNDPQQCLSWQQCKLVLHLVQGNYQLEVFCPPKNATPKMSLFCFLIEDVRPTTSLEIPDSNSSFVIKSHNHGEYVFDAGTKDLQRQWITNIKQYSGARTSGNGHLPTPTVSNGHISPPPSTSSHNSVNGAPPRTSKGKPPSPQFHIECLSESPVVIHHKQQQSKDGGDMQNALHRVDSEDSVLCSFVRNSPQRSPRRQVHSMFIDSPSQLRPLHSPPPSPKQSSPIRSPPPIPQRRGTRPRSISYSNPPPDGSEKNHSHRSIESPTSTLHDELTPGNLETGSASSSSSALHPVSLAAIQQRSHKAAMESSRKVSAPVSPSQLHTQKQPHEREKYASADDLSGPSLLKPEEDRNQGHIRSISDAGRSAPAPTSAEQRTTERYIATPENESTEVPREEVNFISDTSRSSSTSDAEQQSVNPIYVETTELEGYSQAVTYTNHPYASWATTHQDVQNLRNLSQFPWFHGMISRANASQLVLADGEGCYFVRQSESREGDFVLTFNYHNRAKHLRMTVDETGCNIQHLWFNDVPSMLEYFKTNSIPLESFWLNEDVKLSTYIDRAASDAFRTTTVVNVDRLHRNPPRRSRSLHLGRSNAIGGNPATPSPTEQHSVSQGSSSNSLPQVVSGWRQLFRSQRSSSAGNVGRVQRRHSTNAGSILDARRPQSQQDNNYIYRY